MNEYNNKKEGEKLTVHDIDCCDTYQVHDDLLKTVNEKMPEESELQDLADLFKVFGDFTRIRILFVLFEAEVCVCDLAEALDMTQSAISHQLKILKQARPWPPWRPAFPTCSSTWQISPRSTACPVWWPLTVSPPTPRRSWSWWRTAAAHWG